MVQGKPFPASYIVRVFVCVCEREEGEQLSIIEGDTVMVLLDYSPFGKKPSSHALALRSEL